MSKILLAAGSSAHTTVQWATLFWVAGAVVAAAVIIAIIVVLSRRPKSIEDGIAEFSRSLQAVAPSYRLTGRQAPSRARPGVGNESGSVRAMRGETEAV